MSRDEALDWETKDQFVDLLEQFLSGEINSFTFSIKFKERNDLNTEAFNSLKANFILLSYWIKYSFICLLY